MARSASFKLQELGQPTTFEPNGPSNEELSKVGIINLSTKLKVTYSQTNLLKKGLKFVPTPSRTPLMQFQEGCDRFTRSLKLKFCYLNLNPKNQNVETKFRIPSNFSPPTGTYPPEIENLQLKLNQQIRKFKNVHRITDNLTKCDRDAITKLKKDKNIVIKPADKGSAIVIMDRQDYVFEAERQLKVNRHYREINEPQFPDNCTIFNRILAEMLKNNLISKKEMSFLKALPSARQRIFYLLPKIHKEINKWTVPSRIPPGRPIVSDLLSESCNIAKFIDFHLAPFSTTHPAYVKNTYDFLDKLAMITTHGDALLISLDVDSLYTNIDNDLGIRAVTETLARDPKPIHPYIIKLLRLSLEGNDFIFNNKHYLQISGTAMGKTFAPRYADITLAYLEKECLQRSNHEPKLYLRYLDDIILIWEHSETQFE